MEKRKFNRFGRGGAYHCYACGKLTRDTGHDEAQHDLCYLCLLGQYVENAISDYGPDSEEVRMYRAQYEAHKAKGAA